MTPSADLAPLQGERTIAAIATARGGPIGIVRVSGPRAAAIGAALCAPWPDPPRSHHLIYGRVHDPGDGRLLDRALFCLMRGPRSFTGEDILEIHAHGGALNLGEIYQAALRAGASPAQPGEFSLRAFLNGKLELTQAESVAELIGASSHAAARHARRQLDGALGRHLRALRERALHLLADLQGALDFPELEPDPDYAGAPALSAEDPDSHSLDARLRRELPALRADVSALLQSYRSVGRALERGVEIALVGQANAGKSSLLNSLCGRERALVDHEPGTTRDYIEVATEWDGYPVRLVDTAGLRAEAAGVERRGLRQQRARLHHADLVLLVVDGCGPAPLAHDAGSGALAALPPDVPVVIAYNKIDAVACRPPALPLPAATGIQDQDVIPCSALCGWGLAALRRRILDRLLLRGDADEGLVITSARQAEHLTEAESALTEALAAAGAGPTHAAWDLALEALSTCARALGQITGEDLQPHVLDAIFSRFCVGK